MSAGKTKEVADDKWNVVLSPSGKNNWKDRTCKEKIQSVFSVLFKICILLGILYLFICSLGMLGDGFQLLGGKKAGEAFRNIHILSNPIANLMMGVLVTVLLQSSSTTTSIIVAMVGEEILPVGPAIFIVMGANIGTSVTNTIVSMGHAYHRDEYRRAFAGAVVHDIFNWLCVLILLPIEWITSSVGWGDEPCGVLCHLSAQVVKSAQGGTTTNPKLLKVITKPFLSKIVQIDKNVLIEIASNENISSSDVSLLKTYHCKVDVPAAVTVNDTCQLVYNEIGGQPCGFLFEDLAKNGWADWKVGICVLILALVLLIISLFMVVKLLVSMLNGPAARVTQKVINSKFPHPFSWLSGYLAILVGLGMTMLLQSSSIFTSTMTPLVGSGVLHIKRMYPLTLGANIGTTFTAILASLAIGAVGFEKAMQVALCHLFFNIVGILIWYPIPAMRKVPIHLAKRLGEKTAKHRWFALVYILVLFLAVPAIVFALSLAGWQVLLGVLVPILVILIFFLIVNILQHKKPHSLPPKLRTWDALPRPLHSLSFYDDCCSKVACKCCRDEHSDADEDDDNRAADMGYPDEIFHSDKAPIPNGSGSHDNRAFTGEIDTATRL